MGGGKRGLGLQQSGWVVAWACATAHGADHTLQGRSRQVDARMILLSDLAFQAAEGAPTNLTLCPRGAWEERLLVETVWSMRTLGCQGKKVRHRG